MKKVIYFLSICWIFCVGCSQKVENSTSAKTALNEIKAYAQKKGATEDEFKISILEERLPTKEEIEVVKAYIDGIAADKTKPKGQMSDTEYQQYKTEISEAIEKGDKERYKAILEKYNVREGNDPFKKQ